MIKQLFGYLVMASLIFSFIVSPVAPQGMRGEERGFEALNFEIFFSDEDYQFREKLNFIDGLRNASIIIGKSFGIILGTFFETLKLIFNDFRFELNYIFDVTANLIIGVILLLFGLFVMLPCYTYILLYIGQINSPEYYYGYGSFFIFAVLAYLAANKFDKKDNDDKENEKVVEEKMANIAQD